MTLNIVVCDVYRQRFNMVACGVYDGVSTWPARAGEAMASINNGECVTLSCYYYFDSINNKTLRLA